MAHVRLKYIMTWAIFLQAYINAECTRFKLDRKSTTGYYTLVGVSRKSKRKKKVQLLLSQVQKLNIELLLMGHVNCYGWKYCSEVGFSKSNSMILHFDNKDVIHIASNTAYHWTQNTQEFIAILSVTKWQKICSDYKPSNGFSYKIEYKEVIICFVQARYNRYLCTRLRRRVESHAGKVGFCFIILENCREYFENLRKYRFVL